jgi:hypothetical protein
VWCPFVVGNWFTDYIITVILIVIIIQFSSVLYYLCAESTATGPITDSTV